MTPGSKARIPLATQLWIGEPYAGGCAERGVPVSPYGESVGSNQLRLGWWMEAKHTESSKHGLVQGNPVWSNTCGCGSKPMVPFWGR